MTKEVQMTKEVRSTQRHLKMLVTGHAAKMDGTKVTVEVITRGTGETRVMELEFKQNETPHYGDPLEKGLVIGREVKSGKPKSVNLDGLLSVTIGDTKHKAVMK